MRGSGPSRPDTDEALARSLLAVRRAAYAVEARRAVVTTGRANRPARRRYESLGFTSVGDEEVIPDLWITRYARPA